MQPAVALRRLRSLVEKWPDVVETDSWGHPNWKRGACQFASFDSYRGASSICFKVALRSQAKLAKRKHFFLAPYAASRGWVCRALDEPIHWPELAALIKDSYALTAARKGRPTPKGDKRATVGRRRGQGGAHSQR
jgi:predicted DNA-binding protein (MmcQ/YjbR family)